MSDLEHANFSETAASNNAAVPNGAPELWFPSSVNNVLREVMAACKREWNRAGPTVTSGGSANAQTLTYGSAVAALVRGQKYTFIAGFTNTAAATLAVSGLTATAIQYGAAALTGGEIIAGRTYEVMYDGTAYQLMNPSRESRVQAWTAQQYNAEITLTATGSIVWDLNSGQSACISLSTSNIALSAPLNMKAGGTYNLRIVNVGGHTVFNYNTVYKGQLTITSSIGSFTLLSFYSDGTNMYGGAIKGNS